MEYHPHKWLLVQIQDGNEPLYKVFASFYGGYLNGDSWKMNSGITSIETAKPNDPVDCLRFHGYSGSVYVCGKENYGASSYGYGILADFEKRTEGKLKHIPTLQEALSLTQHLMKASND